MIHGELKVKSWKYPEIDRYVHLLLSFKYNVLRAVFVRHFQQIMSTEINNASVRLSAEFIIILFVNLSEYFNAEKWTFINNVNLSSEKLFGMRCNNIHALGSPQDISFVGARFGQFLSTHYKHRCDCPPVLRTRHQASARRYCTHQSWLGCRMVNI